MRYSFGLIFLLLNATVALSQSTYNCKKVLQFKLLLEKEHVRTLKWDSAFTVDVINQIFPLIDPQALFFNKDEIDLFLANAKKINNSILDGDCSFINELAPFYDRALSRAEGFINEINQQPIDFDVKDTLTYNFRRSSFGTTDKTLKNHWLQLVKLSVLNELATSAADSKLIKSKYKSVAEKACKKYLNVIKRRREVEGGVETYLLNKLLNAIAKTYDPHTEFYPAIEKQSLLDMVSSDHYSFGVILEDDPMGNVVIARLIPGSSAWDVKSINIGDVITTINSPHMEKVDASLYDSYEIEEILESISKEVELSVRKVGGENVTVKLIKQKVREDENKIKSLVISNTKNQFGYINLPVFFDKSELTKTGCATELAKEILQLKNAKIQGLVLDLRNNGGGDLSEAIDLAGIFIDRGALAILQERNEEPVTLKDTNLGTVYDGPLVIMINGASASASELFVAAMRDHNRGILLGSTTYGKGTGQAVIYFSATKEDMVKITSFRFYNVKGTSHQGRGIKPDIQLPDMLSELDYREASQDHVLLANTIQKKTYYTPLAPIPIDLLRDSSNQRIAKNVFFQNLEMRKKMISPYRHGSEIRIPLNTNGFVEMNSRMKDEMKDLNPVSDHYKIKLTNFDQQVTGVDGFGQETFKTLIDDVSSDFYIEEALHILTNYVQLKK